MSKTNYEFLISVNEKNIYDLVIKIEDLYSKRMYEPIGNQSRIFLECLVDRINEKLKIKTNNNDCNGYVTLNKALKLIFTKYLNTEKYERFKSLIYGLKQFGNKCSHYTEETFDIEKVSETALKYVYEITCYYYKFFINSDMGWCKQYVIPEQLDENAVDNLLKENEQLKAESQKLKNEKQNWENTISDKEAELNSERIKNAEALETIQNLKNNLENIQKTSDNKKSSSAENRNIIPINANISQKQVLKDVIYAIKLFTKNNLYITERQIFKFLVDGFLKLPTGCTIYKDAKYHIYKNIGIPNLKILLKILEKDNIIQFNNDRFNSFRYVHKKTIKFEPTQETEKVEEIQDNSAVEQINTELEIENTEKNTPEKSEKTNKELFKEIENNDLVDYFNLGLSNFTAQNYDKAIKYFEECIKSDYNSASSHYHLACIYEINDDIEKALENYNKAIEISPDETMFYNMRANCYYNKEYYQEAIDDWNLILEKDNDYNINYFNKAYAEHLLELFEEAIEDYTKDIEISSLEEAEPAPFNNRGLVFKELGRLEKAIEDFTKAIEFDDKDAKYYNNRAEAYFENEDYEKAVKDWNKTLKLNSEYDIDYFDKARAELKIEDYKSSICSSSKYIETHPNSANAHYNRALAYKSCGELGNAIDDLCTAIELDSTDEDFKILLCNTMYTYGKQLFADSNYDEILYLCYKIIKLEAEDEKIYNLCGSVKYIRNDFNGAFEDFQKALNINPDFEPAITNINSVKKILNKTSTNYEDD